VSAAIFIVSFNSSTFTISSDEWCDCMNQCSQDVFDKNKISLGNMEMRVYIKECPSDKDSN